MDKIALNKLRGHLHKRAIWYGGGIPSTLPASGPGRILGSLGKGRRFGQLALYNQAQLLKHQKALKSLARYKNVAKVGGGALGVLALLALTGNLDLSGSDEIKPPTVVNYGQ